MCVGGGCTIITMHACPRAWCVETTCWCGTVLQVRYDALLDQFGSDMALYMSCICDTVIITVPKAIVHCMVRMARPRRWGRGASALGEAGR